MNEIGEDTVGASVGRFGALRHASDLFGHARDGWKSEILYSAVLNPVRTLICPWHVSEFPVPPLGRNILEKSGTYNSCTINGGTLTVVQTFFSSGLL